MSYTVLARRYRSQAFDEVIGQTPIARTLKRAIDSNRVAHAYLFCGTRGVGKTSMARIFAKALNVTDDLEDKDAIADAVMRGDDIDVIEIDGASNRGVDEARDLIAKSIYRPARCPYKIYIIDEVHMLTREAFNALLKTMEEPPSHVKFILCTTEPHKVPATIQSRCQRFDFRNIPTASIAEHLRDVLKQEKVKADDAVVMQVARLANGSMRDGLSLLDRLLAAGEKKITVELLQEMLGLPDQAVIDSLIKALAEADPAQALAVVHELTSRGNSLDQVIEVLVERLREMMIVATCGADSAGAVELSDDEIAEVRELAGHFDLPAIVHMIVLLENVQRSVKSSSTGRALFEAAMVRLALAEKYADVAALLENGPSAGRSIAATSSTKPGAGQKKKPDRPEYALIESRSIEPGAPRASDPEQTADSAPAPVPAATESAAHAALSDASADGSAAPESGDGLAMTPDDLWKRLHRKAEHHPALEALLDHLTIRSLERNTIALELNDPALYVQTKNNIPWLESIMAQETGAALRIDLHVTEQQDRRNAARPSSVAEGRLTRETRESATKIPLVRRAMEMLDMRLVDVEELPDESR